MTVCSNLMSMQSLATIYTLGLITGEAIHLITHHGSSKYEAKKLFILWEGDLAF